MDLAIEQRHPSCPGRGLSLPPNQREGKHSLLGRKALHCANCEISHRHTVSNWLVLYYELVRFRMVIAGSHPDIEFSQPRKLGLVMSFGGALLNHARRAKRHYSEPCAGDFFAAIEEQLIVGAGARVPRWLPKVFQYILNDFSAVDEFGRTDFLSCLLRLNRMLPERARTLDFTNLEAQLDGMAPWDLELALAILAKQSEEPSAA